MSKVGSVALFSRTLKMSFLSLFLRSLIFGPLEDLPFLIGLIDATLTGLKSSCMSMGSQNATGSPVENRIDTRIVTQ